MSKLSFLCLAFLFTTACSSSVLPTSYNRSLSPWASFKEAKVAFDKIEEDKTSLEELKELGYNPEVIPNVHILNYVDVVGQFGSTFKKEDLPDGIQRCITAKEKCLGYVARVKDITQKRVGNVAADLFGFRKKTHITGWVFEAKVVMVDDIVVYKLWNGTPEIEEFESKNTPLGPVQGLGSAVPSPF